MTSREIRAKFLSFFEKHGHAVVPSSSLVPNDPTLLLTAAGMVQFKPVFLGAVKAPYSRAASCQKCVRTTDIERVGHTARHLTFFEMLGNFSFGDYYKDDAIPWAWEFLTNVVKLDPAKLWITIFRDDDEAFQIWRDKVGISEDRIVRMGEKDNFWSAGPTGPCGPCSEIIYDFGPERGCGQPDCQVGCDCDRYLEVWNLVFMQYDRDEQGKLNHLAKKGIDTGMGLERLTSIIEGVETNFETDLIKPIIDAICSRIGGYQLGNNPARDTSIKIIADHARTVTFLIGDGVNPSNEGRGYVLRRILRRAVRHGRLIGIPAGPPFLPDLVRIVIESMSQVYPDLKDNETHILQTAQPEEERFSQTLKQGLNLLSEIIDRVKREGKKMISGDLAFQLFDTYGFPLDLTKEIAEENGLEIEMEQFEKLMSEQRERARAALGEKSWAAPSEVYQDVLDKVGETSFTGYEELSTRDAKIRAILKRDISVSKAEKDDKIELILSQTPFYAEMGGQVGDRGKIITAKGKNQIEVMDTLSPIPGLIVHHGTVTKGEITEGEVATAEVDQSRRAAIARNHTATHLLHWALQKVLGDHVKQAGSLVESERLRFDFTHFEAVTHQQLRQIERLVNERIFKNIAVGCSETTYKDAKEKGAIALFGEKYGDEVRMVEVGDFSLELCGGTHVKNTFEIGSFKIISEGSVGANLRRIEAVTSQAALDYFYQEEDKLQKIASLLKTSPTNAVSRVESLMAELREKEQEKEKLKHQLVKGQAEELLERSLEVNDYKIVTATVSADKMEDLRTFADALKEKLGNGVIVLAASAEGKAMLLSIATEKAVKAGFHAGKLLKEIAPLVGGDGGGRPEMAQAGGKKPEGIKEALDKAVFLISNTLKGNK